MDLNLFSGIELQAAGNSGRKRIIAAATTTTSTGVCNTRAIERFSFLLMIQHLVDFIFYDEAYI